VKRRYRSGESEVVTVPVIEDPRNARSRRTRDALLAAARSVIESNGLEALTMAAVAARAGVSRRAVYLHFRSRSELVTALFAYVNRSEDLAASTRPVCEAPDAATALTEWARHLARYHPRMVPMGRALQRARETDPDAAAHWNLVMRDWRAHCRRLTTRLDREGRLAAPWTVETATDMLWALMSFDVLEGLLRQRRWSPRRLADHLDALFQATFVRRSPGVRR
jgi:AcrR family transcriptional regulator